MLINKEGKLFGKISIIDILVVLAIVVAGFSVYMRFASSGSGKVETVTQKIEYTMVVREVRQGTVDALMKKGPVYDATTKGYLGEITGVESTVAKKQTELTTGEIVTSEVPGYFDVTVTVRIDGKVSDTGYYTGNNNELSVGSRPVFTSKYAKTSGQIVTIREIN